MEENKNEKEEKIQPENESIENETKENQKQGPLESPNLQDNPKETKGIIKEFFNRPIDKISELTKNKGKNLITLAILHKFLILAISNKLFTSFGISPYLSIISSTTFPISSSVLQFAISW